MAFKAEDLDLDTFLNLDGQFGSPSLTTNINKGKGIVTPQYQPSAIKKINTYAPLQTTHNFSGPSHQYELHKQHLPLPPGALANSLAAAQTSFEFEDYSSLGMGSSSGLYDINEDFGDFGLMNGHRPSYGGSNDMDIDFDSPDGLYSNSEFIDPNAIGGHEEDSPVPARAELVRVYPGMHAHQAQQAALAKQQQQMEIQRQQQSKPSQRPQHKPSTSRGSNKAPVDPAVEDRISRLLSQMRHTVNAPTSNNSDDQSPPPAMARSKKEEEEMDEDERLLASEEGKKLSSKERRQLRNKVSARAFRSRRKEYIGQLEGEVAQKSTEADTLRAENEALKAENTRLTDLTKLLLSSSAFSTFLNDLSTNGLPSTVATAPVQPAPSSTTPQPESQQSMNTIIEEDIDFNSLESDSNWNSGMDFSFAPQVFAITEIPEGPIIDANILCGKSTIDEAYSVEESKDLPVIESHAAEKAPQTYTCDESVAFDKEDPAFLLYVDSPSKPLEPVYELFGTISFDKATETFELESDTEASSEDGIVSASTMARFERLCSSLDSLSLRIASSLH